MTFDELLNDLETFKKQAGYKYHEDPNSALDMGFKLNEIEESVKELCETYAPTIRLTQKQYDQLKTAKELTNLMSLCYELINSNHPLYNSLYNLSDKDLATAWLHPETIKVVDSND